MKKFVCGIILGSVLMTGVSYAYRIPKPQRITSFDSKGLIVLNEILEQLWDVTNGRISLNPGSTASTGTGTVKMGNSNNTNSTGFLKFEKMDGTVIYVPYFTTEKP